MNGKGDTPRPVDKEKYDANYEHIFGSEEQVRSRRHRFIRRGVLRKLVGKEEPSMETMTYFEKQIAEALAIPPSLMGSESKDFLSVRQEKRVRNGNKRRNYP